MKRGNWALWEWFTILDERTGEPYLVRLRIVQTPWFGRRILEQE